MREGSLPFLHFFGPVIRVCVRVCIVCVCACVCVCVCVYIVGNEARNCTRLRSNWPQWSVARRFARHLEGWQYWLRRRCWIGNIRTYACRFQNIWFACSMFWFSFSIERYTASCKAKVGVHLLPVSSAGAEPVSRKIRLNRTFHKGSRSLRLAKSWSRCEIAFRKRSFSSLYLSLFYLLRYQTKFQFYLSRYFSKFHVLRLCPSSWLYSCWRRHICHTSGWNLGHRPTVVGGNHHRRCRPIFRGHTSVCVRLHTSTASQACTRKWVKACEYASDAWRGHWNCTVCVDSTVRCFYSLVVLGTEFIHCVCLCVFPILRLPVERFPRGTAHMLAISTSRTALCCLQHGWISSS